MATQNQKISPTLLLAFTLILGFVLRAGSIEFGLPYLYHADEPIVVQHALAYGSGDLNPHFFKIPPLVSYLLFVVYGLFYFAGRLTGLFTSVADFESLFYSDPTLFYLLARLIFGAFLGTLTVYLLYRLVSASFDRVRALLASLFLAVCFLHARDSHYVYVDIPLLAAMTGGIHYFLTGLTVGETRNHLIAGFWIGLAAALKYNGASLLLPYFVAVYFARDKENLGAKMALAALASLLTFFILNPFSLLDASTFLSEINAQSQAQTGAGWIYHVRHSLMGGMTPALFGCSLAGLIFAGIRFEPRKAVLISFVAGYYVLLGFTAQPYDRYVLPLIPFLCFFAADFVVVFLSRPRGNYVGLLLIAAVVVPNLAKINQFNRLMAEEDTRTQAKFWVEKNIPSGAAMAMDIEFYMPRLSFSKKQLEEKRSAFSGEAATHRRFEFEVERSESGPSYQLYALSDSPAEPLSFLFQKPRVPYDLGSLKTAGIEYVIIARLWKKDIHDPFFEQLRNSSQLVAVFNPYELGYPEYALEHPLTGGPFLWKDLASRSRNGQPLEIYKLRS